MKADTPTRLVLAGLLLILAVYAPFAGGYYCGHDDFMEVYRAKFVNAPDPSTLVTRSHFDGFKYRPLNHAMVLVTFWLGDGAAWVFRWRNLLFHCLNVWLVFMLAGRLGMGRGPAAAGSLLFGLHPLTNQTIAGASWTNTMAHACFLSSLLCVSLMRQTRRVAWAAGAAAALLLGLGLYDGALMLVPTWVCWLGWWWYRGDRPAGGWRALGWLAVLSMLGVTGFFALRAAYVPAGAGIGLVPPGLVVRNTVMYAAALSTPLDPVLLNALWGVSLPSRAMMSDPGIRLWLAAAMLVAIAAGAAVLHFLRRRHWSQRIPGGAVLLLGSAAAMSVQPMLWLTSMASETYVYLPIALLGPVVACLGWAALEALGGNGARRLAMACLLVWLSLALPALLARNQRVAACGELAGRILANLPNQWRDGAARQVELDPAHGSLSGRNYGLYHYSGLDVLGYSWPDDKAVQEAIRLYFRNPGLTVSLGRSGRLSADCGTTRWCAWVDGKGQVRPVTSAVPEVGGSHNFDRRD